MAQSQIGITIQDDWPNIKICVTDGHGGFQTKSVQYDIAITSFEPVILNVVRKEVQQLIQQRRKGR
jgi:hypothetical protein